MTTDERIENREKGLAAARRLNRWLPACAAVCLGLIFAWVFFAQPGPLGTAQASGPANPYEAENTKLQADFNLLKRENERLRKELDEAKKDKAAAPTDAQGPPTPQPATAQAQAVDVTAKVIRANSFILKDENDKVRAVLSMEAGGRRLGLFNATGKELAFLEVTEKTGPVLTFMDAAGRQVWSTANATPSPAPAKRPKPTLADVAGAVPAHVKQRPENLWTPAELGQHVLEAQEATELDTLQRKEKESWNACVNILLSLQDPVARNDAYQKYIKDVSSLRSPNATVNRKFQHYLSEVMPERQAYFNAVNRNATPPPPPPPPPASTPTAPATPRQVAPPVEVAPPAPRSRLCPMCNGSGKGLICPHCNDTGKDGPFNCPFCNGRGSEPCKRCNGKGTVSD